MRHQSHYLVLRHWASDALPLAQVINKWLGRTIMTAASSPNETGDQPVASTKCSVLFGWQASTVESWKHESISILCDQRRINSGSRNFDYLDMIIFIWRGFKFQVQKAQHDVAWSRNVWRENCAGYLNRVIFMDGARNQPFLNLRYSVRGDSYLSLTFRRLTYSQNFVPWVSLHP